MAPYTEHLADVSPCNRGVAVLWRRRTLVAPLRPDQRSTRLKSADSADSIYSSVASDVQNGNASLTFVR